MADERAILSCVSGSCITESAHHLSDDLICLQLVGEAKVSRLLTAELTLVNSLPELLKDCSFTIEGVGLTDGKPLTHKCVG